MLDRRLHAYRPDLADTALKGRVEAERFTEGEPASVVSSLVDLRRAPDHALGIDTQLLHGETVRVLERKGGWAWVVADRDHYVGYAEERHFGPPHRPGKIVTALRTFAYSAPDMKSPVVRALSMGSPLATGEVIETRGSLYHRLADNSFVMDLAIAPLERTGQDDWAGLAARFLETPYLWGGASAFGIDCSGLAQLCLRMCGKPAPRDSDMQAASLGTVIDGAERRRGDLVFWKGHVAIVEDRDHVIHANGHRMAVTRESLDEANARIRPVYGEPTVWRRP